METWKIPLFKIFSDEKDINAVNKVLKRGSSWAVGPEIEEFEKKISSFIGRKYALAYNSGTSALHCALEAIGIKGKEVIVPSFTFISGVTPVIMAGGKPIFAETETETFGLDSKDVIRKITPLTKAILAFHYGGIPSKDINKLRNICKEKKIFLIEDAAESIGSSIENIKVGSFGEIAMFSTCQNKVLPTGEGGILVMDSENLYQKCKLLRSHGRVEEQKDYFSNIKDNDYISIGYNYRMPSIIAALGISQYEKINWIISKRREIAKKFTKELSNIKQISCPKEILGHFQIYQMYTIKLPSKEIRDNLQINLSKKGIMSKVYFNPVHLKTIFIKKYGCKKGDLPITEDLSNRVLNIPLYPTMSEEESDYLLNSIKEFFNG
jgi:perosamine synthetase